MEDETSSHVMQASTEESSDELEGRSTMRRTIASPIGWLTTDLIMARTGVYEPMATKELILRDEAIVGIQEECAQSLLSLEVLSLSHNMLTTLDGFQHLSNLIELNLNLNQITSVDNLHCPFLEKLFVANNRIVDIAPLRGLHKLNTLSLYGNLITDLDASLNTCRALPKLRALDLGGNPCSHEIEGYKFQVLRSLPRLKSLDGEQVTQLDKELTEEFTRQDRPLTAAERPSTATSIGSRSFTASAKPWEVDAPPATPSKPFDAFASKHMPKGNVRLFRDDFLNNNPILLEYLAQETSQPQAQVLTLGNDTDPEDAAHSSSSGFVEKMRTANPLSNDSHTNFPHPEVDEDHQDQDQDQDQDRPATTGSRPTTAAINAFLATSNLGVDPSDPKTTIRKLIKHIEVLEASLASYTTHQVEASEQALFEENRRLQIENNNIPILQEEIVQLKKKLNHGGMPGCPPVPTAVSVNDRRLRELETENEQLRREVARLKKMLKSNEVTGTEPVKVNGSKQGATRRLSESDALLEDSAAMDVELTELILQNEVSLEMIRNDIKNVKKEWEAAVTDGQRSRPQTALGVSLSSSGSLESLRVAGPATVGKPTTTSDLQRRGRQLHTSAGFRHGAGPEELLLQQANGTSQRGSVANVLTL